VRESKFDADDTCHCDPRAERTPRSLRPRVSASVVVAPMLADQNGLHANSLDASDEYFFDTSTHTLYQCDFSNGTLVLHDAVVTINADIPTLQTSDFLLI
jgi:hypothetical protein